jgi:hypothetical protein
MIYTHDEAARIVEMFENVLDFYNIKIPSPDDEFREEDNDAKLYGSTYAALLDEVEDALMELLYKYQIEIASANLRGIPPQIVNGEFSGTF